MYDDYSDKIDSLTEESGALRKGKQNSGRRHSKLNTQLAIAVTNTPMGPTGVGEFLTQLHIHPGSEDGCRLAVPRCRLAVPRCRFAVPRLD